MPNATVYIRNSNWEKWEAIEDKSAFINESLEKETTPDFSDYIYDPATQLIFNKETQEQVPGKVDGNGKIVAVYE